MTYRTRKAKPKSYILLGPDEFARPRGARFSDEDPELLVKAAEAMHLWLIEVANRDLAKAAALLPAGRLHASEDELVPYIENDVYSEVLSTAIDDIPWPPRDVAPTAQDLPRSWDEIAPGHLVIARETLECGWYEAVVIERNGDLLTLRWRDYPLPPDFVRHRSVVALICAAKP